MVTLPHLNTIIIIIVIVIIIIIIIIIFWAVYSHWSLKSRDRQQVFAKFRLQTRVHPVAR